MNIFDEHKKQAEEAVKMARLFSVNDACRISEYTELSGVPVQRVIDAVKLGDWKEVDKLKGETVVTDGDVIDGLIIKGYETKFGTTNENGERYDKECLDDFIERYYIKHHLNMPVTVCHGGRMEDYAGRVLLVEVNTVGFYFVCYIPRTYERYDSLLSKIKNGIMQGLSKEGWSTDCDWIYKKDGTFDYVQIKKMEITAMSIVACPANGIPFEKVQQIKNALQYFNNTKKTQDNPEQFGKMFH